MPRGQRHAADGGGPIAADGGGPVTLGKKLEKTQLSVLA